MQRLVADETLSQSRALLVFLQGTAQDAYTIVTQQHMDLERKLYTKVSLLERELSERNKELMALRKRVAEAEGVYVFE